MKRLMVIAAVLGVSLCAAAQGSTITQRAILHATPQVQTWRSDPFTATLHLHAYTDGEEIPQIESSACAALYSGHGVAISLVVSGCHPGALGRFVLRYVAVESSHRTLTVEVSRR